MYTYFISYSHPNGFGSVCSTLNYKLDTVDMINHYRQVIEDEFNIGTIVIIYFIRIKNETIWSRGSETWGKSY